MAKRVKDVAKRLRGNVQNIISERAATVRERQEAAALKERKRKRRERTAALKARIEAEAQEEARPIRSADVSN